MMLEMLVLLVVAYFLSGLTVYGFAVFKTFEFTGIWTFKIDKQYIGICKYPRWLLGWMYWIGVKLNGLK